MPTSAQSDTQMIPKSLQVAPIVHDVLKVKNRVRQRMFGRSYCCVEIHTTRSDAQRVSPCTQPAAEAHHTTADADGSRPRGLPRGRRQVHFGISFELFFN